jgi:poly(A) polymerase
VSAKEIQITLPPTLRKSPLYGNALKIIARLKQQGHEGYFVGGFVRDLLLQKSISDIDIATNATPANIQKIFRHTIPVGAQFGVVIVRMGGKSYQVATYRQDLNYRDGRRPTQVVYTNIDEDVLRRDFTVNGLIFNPATEIGVDGVGGLIDLKSRIIRAIGDPTKRFSEDKLRMLRAIRFAANLNFTIESITWAAIQAMAKEISVVSSERIREELEKMLIHGHSARALTLLDESGILAVILPEVSHLHGVEQPPDVHPEGDVFTHVRKMLELSDQLPEAEQVFSLKLAILLHDLGKPYTQTITDRIRFHGHDKLSTTIAREILTRLKCANHEADLISAMVAKHMHFMQVENMKTSTLRKFIGQDRFDLHLALHRIDCLASHSDLSSYHFLQGKMEQLKKADQDTLPRSWVSGADLIQLGFKPSPRFKELLSACYDQQLENAFADKTEAMEWIQKYAQK